MEKHAHLPLHHWNGCMKFDSQANSFIFRPRQEKAGEQPSLWAGALDSGNQDFLYFRITFLLGRVEPLRKTTIKIFRFAQIPQILGRCGFFLFLLAQQSVIPSITKPGLTIPCKDWEIRDCGSDQNQRSNILLDPSDVITGGGKTDKEILLRRLDCVFICLTLCVIQLLSRKSSISLSHSIINNSGCLATGNTYIYSRKEPLWLHICSFGASPNSMTATVQDDSPRPMKAIIWHQAALCPPRKAACF